MDDDAGRLGWGAQCLDVREEARQPRAELVELFATLRGDRDNVDLPAPPRALESLPGRRGRGQVDLVEGHEHRLLEQCRVVRRELVPDRTVVPLGVARRAIDDVDQHARPFDVTQERVAEPGALARALDESRNVGDRGTALVIGAEVEHPEVRFERGEWIVRDPGPSGRQRGQQSRLPGIRQTDQPNVGDQPELEAQPALLAGLALLGVLRGLVRRCLEVNVAEPAPPAARDHHLLTNGHEVGEQLTGRIPVDRRARRDRQDQILACLAVPSGAGAPATWSRSEVMRVLEVAQRCLPSVDPHVDRAATPSVASVGSAARDMRFTSEARRAIAASTRGDPDLHAVEKHRWDSRTPGGSARGCGQPLYRGWARRRDPRGSRAGSPGRSRLPTDTRARPRSGNGAQWRARTFPRVRPAGRVRPALRRRR